MKFSHMGTIGLESDCSLVGELHMSLVGAEGPLPAYVTVLRSLFSQGSIDCDV